MVTQEELEKMSPEEIAKLQKENCIFCKIIGGSIPSSKIFENDTIISVLDINPANKGHAVIMPKEHYPILPLVPPETFKQMFLDTKTVSTAIKSATLAGSTAIFIANGALAGQNAPHFLFHVIPDHKFSYPSKPELKDKNNALADSLKNNLKIMMDNHANREGISAPQPTSQSVPQAPLVPVPSPEQLAQRKEQIAKIIEENADVRKLLKTDVESFRKTIEQSEELKQIFSGVDLDGLSKNLIELEKTKPIVVTEKTKEQLVDSEDKLTVELNSSKESVQEMEPSAVMQYATKPKPEVFLGVDPLAQKEKLFAYFEEKPKAKELLMSDVKKFKQLLETRADVQPIFANVNLEKLSQKLNESFRGDSHN